MHLHLYLHEDLLKLRSVFHHSMYNHVRHIMVSTELLPSVPASSLSPSVCERVSEERWSKIALAFEAEVSEFVYVLCKQLTLCNYPIIAC